MNGFKKAHLDTEKNLVIDLEVISYHISLVLAYIFLAKFTIRVWSEKNLPILKSGVRSSRIVFIYIFFNLEQIK